MSSVFSFELYKVDRYYSLSLCMDMIIRSTRTGLSLLYFKPVPEWVFQERPRRLLYLDFDKYLLFDISLTEEVCFCSARCSCDGFKLSNFLCHCCQAVDHHRTQVFKLWLMVCHRLWILCRGHPALLPEHSEPGYISAIKHGADFIECDVHFTRWHELLTLWERQLITIFLILSIGGEYTLNLCN